jgi:hypothetical protein
MSIQAQDGSLNVKVVDGLSYTGILSPEGWFNVIEAPGFGVFHPCGAYRVTFVTAELPPPLDGSAYLGSQAKDGSLYVTTLPGNGLYHPIGCWRVTIN